MRITCYCAEAAFWEQEQNSFDINPKKLFKRKKFSFSFPISPVSQKEDSCPVHSSSAKHLRALL